MLVILATQSIIVWALIYVSDAIRIAALARCVWSGLFRKYTFFFAMVSLSLARNGAIIFLKQTQDFQFLKATLWPAALLEAAAVVEAFWVFARHFRTIRGFAWILIAIVASIAGLAGMAVSALRVNWAGEWNGLSMFGAYTHAAFLVMALLTLVFFRQFRRIPIRPNAIRHIVVLSLFFAAYFAANLVIQRGQTSPGPVWTANLLLNLGPIFAFGLWAILMTRAGEELPFEPAPEISPSEFEASEAEHERAENELRRSSEEVLRKAVRR